jgi:hypothetical protein
MVLLSILLGLQLVAADPVPVLDIGPGCRATVDMAGMSEQTCLVDERAARDDLAKVWSGFAASDKAMCVDQTRSYNPSYVELLTCLELMRDARIPYRPNMSTTPPEPNMSTTPPE